MCGGGSIQVYFFYFKRGGAMKKTIFLLIISMMLFLTGCDQILKTVNPEDEAQNFSPQWSITEGGQLSCENKNIQGDIVIPDMVNGINVVTIMAGAFRDCKNLTSVTIPSSVLIIGDYAFQRCKGLRRISIPDSVVKIGIGVFFRLFSS